MIEELFFAVYEFLLNVKNTSSFELSTLNFFRTFAFVIQLERHT
jgi:hypothetical protein